MTITVNDECLYGARIERDEDAPARLLALRSL